MTVEQITDIIMQEHAKENERIEQNRKLIEWASRNYSKRLTERNKPEGWIIAKSYGMTSLETPDYRMSQGNSGRSILLAHSVVNVTIPLPDEMAKECGQDTCMARQARRSELLSDYAGCIAIAVRIKDVNDAARKYQEAKEAFDKQIEDNVDSYTLEKHIVELRTK